MKLSLKSVKNNSQKSTIWIRKSGSQTEKPFVSDIAPISPVGTGES